MGWTCVLTRAPDVIRGSKPPGNGTVRTLNHAAYCTLTVAPCRRFVLFAVPPACVTAGQQAEHQVAHLHHIYYREVNALRLLLALLV